MNSFRTDGFELDIIELYNKANIHIQHISMSQAWKGRYLFKIRSDIRHYCRLSCINYNIHFKQKKPLIIPSSHFLYFRFLPLALAHFPIEELPAFLEYQLRHFEGNVFATREQFKIHLQEDLLGELKLLSFSDTKLRVERVKQWLSA